MRRSLPLFDPCAAASSQDEVGTGDDEPAISGRSDEMRRLLLSLTLIALVSATVSA
jgi:hypothetical protein